MLIPFTYSIANGLGFGIIAWAVLHLFALKVRRQDWLLYVIAALFLGAFYLSRRQLGPASMSPVIGKRATMHWYDYLAYFFGGAFLANASPSDQRHLRARVPMPFANPPGKGLSSSTVNVLWGFFNLIVAYLLILCVGNFSIHDIGQVAAVGAGMF